MSADNKQGVDVTQHNNKDGEFVRKASAFRNKVTADGSSGFKAEANRYHLYVSYACPWVYKQSDPNYEGRYTVPVLYDKQTKKIVNNESAEIIVMLNKEFNQFAKHPELDLYPEELQQKIEELNAWIYDGINNAVYKCGFATTQAAYEKSYYILFESLDRAEDILSKNRFLTGDKLTLADVRLWTTLLRFDPVYYSHFKTNKKRLVDYPNLWRFTRELYQMPEIKRTVNMEHIKSGYYGSQKSINPTGIVPVGPEINFDAPIHSL